MAIFASMVIADALGAPVNHTFIPLRTPNGVYTWQDQTAANNPNRVPVGYNQIGASATMSKDVNAGKGRFVLDHRYLMPTLETISNSTSSGILPAATWAYDCAIFTKFVFSARSSLQNRQDTIKMGALSLQNAQLVDWLTLYQPPV